MLSLAIGADHRGYEHKMVIQTGVTLQSTPLEWIDVGTFSPERTDYPPFARLVVDALQTQQAQLGILICGTGTGMAIAANRFQHIYAGVVWNEMVARRSREEDNINVLVIPSDFVTPEESISLVLAWLHASFKKGRYQDRIRMIDEWHGL